MSVSCTPTVLKCLPGIQYTFEVSRSSSPVYLLQLIKYLRNFDMRDLVSSDCFSNFCSNYAVPEIEQDIKHIGGFI